MNKSLHRSSIPKYRCEKKTALPILEWGIHSEIFNWWRWRDSNPRPSDYDSLKPPRIDRHVTSHISFILGFFTTLNIRYVTTLGVEQWSKFGAEESDSFPKFFLFRG